MEKELVDNNLVKLTPKPCSGASTQTDIMNHLQVDITKIQQDMEKLQSEQKKKRYEDVDKWAECLVSRYQEYWDEGKIIHKEYIDEDMSMEDVSVLQENVKKITSQARELKAVVQSLKDVADWLTSEASRLGEENRQYVRSLQERMEEQSKDLTSVRQNSKDQIVHAENQWQNQLQNLAEKCHELEKTKNEKKIQLDTLKRELEGLEVYRRLQAKQTKEIQDLEAECEELSTKQEKEKAVMSTVHLRIERQLKRMNKSRVNQIIHAADQTIGPALIDELSQTCKSNVELQKELKKLNTYLKSLRDAKGEMEKHRDSLVMEIKYWHELNSNFPGKFSFRNNK